MTTKRIPLEQRVLVIGAGDEIKFTDMSAQLQDIARNLYEKSNQGTTSASYTLEGSPSDGAVFSGRMTSVLSLVKDFIAGDYNEKGRIKMGTGKGGISVGLGMESTDFQYEIRGKK